jgi:hypothetical protein
MPGALRRRDSELPGNHLLELADADGFLYLTGNCGCAGGLSPLDLRDGRVNVLNRRRSVCGSRLLADGTRLVLAANSLPLPKPGAASRILVVDRRDGRYVAPSRPTARSSTWPPAATGPSLGHERHPVAHIDNHFMQFADFGHPRHRRRNALTSRDFGPIRDPRTSV